MFGAATDEETLEELKRLELDILGEGQIGGLNGVLLGAAAEAGLPGACLLGEMPHVFTQFPFPKASLAILEAFTTMSGVELDLTELSEQANVMEEQLGDLFSRVEQRIGEQQDEGEEDEEGYRVDTPDEEQASAADRERIERLFEQAEPGPVEGVRAEAVPRPARGVQGLRGPVPRSVQEVVTGG